MAEVKLTKNELRDQQTRLGQLDKYLPTLQLKKAMLQAEVSEARLEIARLLKAFDELRGFVEGFSSLFSDCSALKLPDAVEIEKVHKDYENIAGVDIPQFRKVIFKPLSYRLFDTPLWIDSAVKGLQDLLTAQVRVAVAKEKKEALEKELREVSIRVNLFEKVLIPRALANIKKIKIFLGDQQLAAVSQAKVAKGKIIASKAAAKEMASHAS